MNNWREENNSLVKEFKFADFKAAMVFINKVAEIADSLNHHPEITNIYNKVTLRLSTHEAGDTVTEKDREIADSIDQIKIAT